MNTAVVEIRDEAALGFLRSLERMRVLRVVSTGASAPLVRQRPSERFAGCLSSARADELQAELLQMRSEWSRGTL
ncbi:MAG: hypothetical protein LBS63_00160 [Prevotellaceae bacterium]|jgi:hypothetical protein|nr:hypothetical protein [Prevotellaceae bacterium]